MVVVGITHVLVASEKLHSLIVIVGAGGGVKSTDTARVVVAEDSPALFEETNEIVVAPSVSTNSFVQFPNASAVVVACPELVEEVAIVVA